MFCYWKNKYYMVASVFEISTLIVRPLEKLVVACVFFGPLIAWLKSHEHHRLAWGLHLRPKLNNIWYKPTIVINNILYPNEAKLFKAKKEIKFLHKQITDQIVFWTQIWMCDPWNGPLHSEEVHASISMPYL